MRSFSHISVHLLVERPDVAHAGTVSNSVPKVEDFHFELAMALEQSNVVRMQVAMNVVARVIVDPQGVAQHPVVKLPGVGHCKARSCWSLAIKKLDPGGDFTELGRVLVGLDLLDSDTQDLSAGWVRIEDHVAMKIEQLWTNGRRVLLRLDGKPLCGNQLHDRPPVSVHSVLLEDVRASERADVRALPILGDALHFFPARSRR